MELLIATSNLHKKQEIQQILGNDFLVKSLQDVGIMEEIPENGESFQENAAIKAHYCFEKTGIPCLGDDSGLVIDALDGRPGIFSARYAGDHDFEKNMEKVLSEMEGISERDAYFITVLHYFDGKENHNFMGKVFGKITLTRDGQQGFGYDPIFIPEGYDRTFAAMRPEEKNAISHRKKALNEFLSFIQPI